MSTGSMNKVLFALILLCLCGCPRGEGWWIGETLYNEHSQGGEMKRYSSGEDVKRYCSSLVHGLNQKQMDICQQFPDLMASVLFGMVKTVTECQAKFHEHRWNCSVMQNNGAGLQMIRKLANKESAFFLALLAAGVAHEVTKDCSKGELVSCGCDATPRESSNPNWQWSGCSHNFQFGRKFSEEFVDALDEKDPGSPRTDYVLHNQRAGREAIIQNIGVNCRCHGVSGSCPMKTCSQVQPDFRSVSANVMQKYSNALEMKPSYRTTEGGSLYRRLVPPTKRSRKPNARDLVYLDQSPTYCLSNAQQGIIGTRGRECNITSSGESSCDDLCCRRGYTVDTSPRNYPCNCVFVWCCRVKCDTCMRIQTTYTCL